MKRTVYYLITSVIAVLVFSLFFYTNALASGTNSTAEKNITTISIPQYEKNINGVKKVSGSTVLSKLKAHKTFVLFIGFKECPYCRKFSPVLKKYLNYQNKRRIAHKANTNVYYLNIDQYRNKDTKRSALQYMKILKVTNLKTTPTVDKFIHGKLNKKIANANVTFKELKAALY
ncbi:thioredoxin fold domain-containing protein [Levilactobacillus brevis]|uniref:thioredoxin fold domain-containing protein n=1 Tax=Levilactobacillus brevis TaxID=1580 RepID=UPI00046591BA|nr:thioredoxin fold domain-containing protein [Levilactobacillus brevis]